VPALPSDRPRRPGPRTPATVIVAVTVAGALSAAALGVTGALDGRSTAASVSATSAVVQSPARSVRAAEPAAGGVQAVSEAAAGRVVAAPAASAGRCPAGRGVDLRITSDCVFTGGGVYGNVTITGARVSVADMNQTLRFKSLVVMGRGASFAAGCPRPITRQVLIVMTEKNAKANPMGMGAGVLGAHDADFCLKGARVDRRFDTVDRTYRVGARTAATKNPMGLRKGDRLLFTASTSEPGSRQVVTVTRATGRTFGFTPALRYDVLNEKVSAGGRSIVMNTEVARLSGSNLVVATARGARSHVMTMGRGTTQISGVDLRGVGADFKQYCVHLHLKGDSPHSFVEHSACERPNSRAFVMHGTNKARFEDLVSYESRGSSYLLGEGGPERGNLFKHLLAANPRPAKLGTDDFDAIGQTDNGPSGFWSAASDNVFTDLHAAGIQDGWGVRFDFARFTKNRGVLSGTPGNPSRNRAGIIDGIVAHAVGEPNPGHVCDRFICGTAVFITVKAPLKNDNPRWDKEYDSQFTFAPYAMNHVTAWKSHVGVWATRGVNITNSAVADTCRAYVLQDARLDSSLAMGLTGRGDGGNRCGDTYQGTEAYDFKTVVTNSVFANYGTRGTKGGAFGHWGSQGHDQNVHYGVNAYFNVKLVNVANVLHHPGLAGQEVARNCTARPRGSNGWVRNVGPYKDGYWAFPCAVGGTVVPRSGGMKWVPLSQRGRGGGPERAQWDRSHQHGDPFTKPALMKPLPFRTAPTTAQWAAAR